MKPANGLDKRSSTSFLLRVGLVSLKPVHVPSGARTWTQSTAKEVYCTLRIVLRLHNVVLDSVYDACVLVGELQTKIHFRGLLEQCSGCCSRPMIAQRCA